jgi:hypothetical protein
MIYHDGQLLPYFAVACGMCHDSVLKLIMDTTTGIGRTKTEARAILERERWAYTRNWGWICPRCDQFGSAGVVPEAPK